MTTFSFLTPGLATFEGIVARIRNMKGYGMGRNEILSTLSKDGVSNELLFFAWTGSEMLDG